MEKLQIDYLLDTKDVAKILGTNVNAVGRLVQKGLLPFCHNDGGKKRKFKASDVNNYVTGLETFRGCEA